VGGSVGAAAKAWFEGFQPLSSFGVSCAVCCACADLVFPYLPRLRRLTLGVGDHFGSCRFFAIVTVFYSCTTVLAAAVAVAGVVAAVARVGFLFARSCVLAVAVFSCTAVIAASPAAAVAAVAPATVVVTFGWYLFPFLGWLAWWLLGCALGAYRQGIFLLFVLYPRSGWFCFVVCFCSALGSVVSRCVCGLIQCCAGLLVVCEGGEMLVEGRVGDAVL
jgi:hypothetical protein